MPRATRSVAVIALLALLVWLPLAEANPAAAPTAPVPAAKSLSVLVRIDDQELRNAQWTGAIRVIFAPPAEGCGPEQRCITDLLTELASLEQLLPTGANKARHETPKNIIGNIRARVAALGPVVADLDGDGVADQRSGPDLHYGQVTLTVPLAAAAPLIDWWQAGAGGEVVRKQVSITLPGADGRPAATYVLGGSYPVALTLRPGGEMVGRVTLRYQSVERAPIGVNEGGLPANPKGAPIGVKEEGVPVRLMGEKADLGLWYLATPVAGALGGDCASAGACDQPVTCTAESCTAGLNATLDDLANWVQAAGTASRHDTAKNAIGNIRRLTADLGNALAGTTLQAMPGRTTYATITLKRPLNSEGGVADWVKGIPAGAPWRKSGSIIYLDREGNEVLRAGLGLLTPIRYQLYIQDTYIVEEIEFVVERVERN